MSARKATDQVQDILDAVRAAGEAAGDDAKASKSARQAKAAEPDVVSQIARIPEGSPDGLRLRRELAALGVAAGALKASLKWHRASTGGGAPAQTGRPQASEIVSDGRPCIEIDTELHVVAAAATEALRSDDDLYQRDGALVHVLCASQEDERPGLMRGTPVLRPMVAATLLLRMCAVAMWIREGKRGPAVTTPPSQVVSGVLAMGEWRGLRHMVGIVERPSLRPDGTVIDEPGYDASTGFLYSPNAKEFRA